MSASSPLAVGWGPEGGGGGGMYLNLCRFTAYLSVRAYLLPVCLMPILLSIPLYSLCITVIAGA